MSYPTPHDLTGHDPSKSAIAKLIAWSISNQLTVLVLCAALAVAGWMAVEQTPLDAVPDLTEERRKELAKLAGKYAENAKIAIRNVRRDGMEALKEDEKKKEIGEDDRKRSEDEVQKLTDKYVAEVEKMLQAKESDLMEV